MHAVHTIRSDGGGNSASTEPSWCPTRSAGRVIVMGVFRFSCNFFGVSSGDAFVDKCRRAEEYGYDAVLAPDHLGAPAPFPLLVAAAAATARLRVGTLVLNVPFWNPALLAREVATTDILTGGRLEVGLGAGHMKWEFDEAGIDWKPFSTRADQLATTITELERFFTTDFEPLPEGALPPRPVQRRGFGGSGPPLLVGGTGDRILRIAAAHADIVSVAGLYQLAGKPPGTFRLGDGGRGRGTRAVRSGVRGTAGGRDRVASARSDGGRDPRSSRDRSGADHPPRGGHDRRRRCADTLPAHRHGRGDGGAAAPYSAALRVLVPDGARAVYGGVRTGHPAVTIMIAEVCPVPVEISAPTRHAVTPPVGSA